MSMEKERIIEIEKQCLSEIRIGVDKTFQQIFIFQWILVISISLWRSPLTWIGETPFINPHLSFSVFFGGLIVFIPIFLIKKNPGTELSMYLVTFCQALFSMMIIHVSGGRIESHFHVFGSLAFLVSYRSYNVIIFSSLLIAIGHLVMGTYSPIDLYGSQDISSWRTVEHVAWIVFEDIFLFSILKNKMLFMKRIAFHQDLTEQTLLRVEDLVIARTAELEESQIKIMEQQQSLMQASKLSSLGEMAAGVAHEINNPLAIIHATTKYMRKKITGDTVERTFVEENLEVIEKTVKRISTIVLGLKNVSRDGDMEISSECKFGDIINDVIGVCEERFRNEQICVTIKDLRENPDQVSRFNRVQLSQVLLNLLGNSFDAIMILEEKWMKIEISEEDHLLIVKVIDSGKTICPEIEKKIFQPFFTSKGIGKGTGLGLSISKGILNRLDGDLYLDKKCKNTCFVIQLPISLTEAA